MARPRQEFPPKISILTARNQARVWWANQWHYLGAAGSPEAHAAYATLLYQIAMGDPNLTPPPPKAPPTLTVADVVARWFKEGALELTDRGREVEAFRFSVPPLLRLFGPLPAADFGAGQLLQVRVVMVSGAWMTPEEKDTPQRRGKVGWARPLVNQRIGRIKSIFRWAELTRLVPAGAYAGLQCVKPLRENARGTRENKPRQGPDWGVFRRVLRECPPVVRSLLLVGWWSGARPGELARMKAGEVDTSGEVWVYRPAQHKTDYLGHDRSIMLGPKARAALAPWLAQATSTTAYVFPPSRARTHPYYVRNSLCQVISRACELAGVKGAVTAYLARHAAKERIERKEGIHAARVVLGHRSVSTTARYGAPIDTDHARDVQRKIG